MYKSSDPIIQCRTKAKNAIKSSSNLKGYMCYEGGCSLVIYDDVKIQKGTLKIKIKKVCNFVDRLDKKHPWTDVDLDRDPLFFAVKPKNIVVTPPTNLMKPLTNSFSGIEPKYFREYKRIKGEK